MTVIGPVKKNKMPYYKDNNQLDGEESSEDLDQSPFYSSSYKEAPPVFMPLQHAGNYFNQYASAGQPQPSRSSSNPSISQPPQHQSSPVRSNSSQRPTSIGPQAPLSPRVSSSHPSDRYQMVSKPPGTPGSQQGVGVPSGLPGGMNLGPSSGPLQTLRSVSMPEQGSSVYYPPRNITPLGGLYPADEINLSEFPALGAPTRPPTGPLGGALLQGSLALSSGNYGLAGIKKPGKLNSNQEFNMLAEEFPSLPGVKPNRVMSEDGFNSTPSPTNDGGALGGFPSRHSGLVHNLHDRGHHHSGPAGGGGGGKDFGPDAVEGNSNLDQLVSHERFGLLGLLNVIRMSEHDQISLALGTDLTSLGLNLNSADVLYPTFASPWADTPMRPKDPQFQLPAYYAIKAPLPAMSSRFQQLSDETLFYAFYSMSGDAMQQAAASILYEHNWRYHKEHKIWITRAPGMEPSQKTAAFERGTYIYFDIITWKKVTKELTLQYDHLEERKAALLPQ